MELKITRGNYYLYVAKDIWDKKKKKFVKKAVLNGSIDESGTYREKGHHDESEGIRSSKVRAIANNMNVKKERKKRISTSREMNKVDAIT